MKMLDPGFCSPRFLLPFREESGDEELSVLPRHTKVIVTGNNRTKSVLVGLHGVVKKAVGLGGWHWLVLKNGVEVKLQRNALSVLEPPTGNEEDEDDFDNSSSGSDINEKDNGFSSGIEFSKIRKPKVKYTRPFVSSMSAKSINDSSYKEVQSNNKTSHQLFFLACLSENVNKQKDELSSDLDHLQSIGELERSSPIPEMRNMPSIRGIKRVNLAKLGTSSLWRYWRHFKLGHANPNISREQLVNTVQQHFASWRVDEFEVITEFIHASKRLKSAERE